MSISSSDPDWFLFSSSELSHLYLSRESKDNCPKLPAALTPLQLLSLVSSLFSKSEGLSLSGMMIFAILSSTSASENSESEDTASGSSSKSLLSVTFFALFVFGLFWS